MIKSAAGLNWLRELLWWLFTLVFVAAVLYPIQGYIKSDHQTINILFIVLSVTYFRFIIFLDTVPYLGSTWTKVGLFIINALIFFQFLRAIQGFLDVIDSHTLSSFLTEEYMFAHAEEVDRVFMYFKREYILFATTCQMLLVILNVRLLYSVWSSGKHISNE